MDDDDIQKIAERMVNNSHTNPISGKRIKEVSKNIFVVEYASKREANYSNKTK